MAEWHGYGRHYRRVGRPRSPATLARTIVDMAAGNVGQEKRRRDKAHISARGTRDTRTVGHKRRASAL